MPQLSPSLSTSALRSADIIAVSGANEGDVLSFAAELVLGDFYQVRQGARRKELALQRDDAPGFVVAETSEIGTPGARVYLDSTATLMARNATLSELILLVQLDAQGNVAEIFAHPLTPLAPKTDYQLIALSTEAIDEKFAQTTCAAFTRGTHITLSTGGQRPIEDLRTGDAVLTRDAGAQKIRWIDQRTQRAVGDFAPVCIAAGALNNARDLLVSPDHRMFVYQRTDHLGAGRAQILIKAAHLVNGHSVTVQPGGFVEYYQLFFDTHQIIYAEGIAVESAAIDAQTTRHFPRTAPDRIENQRPLWHRAPLALDLPAHLLDRPDVANVLRSASSG